MENNELPLVLQESLRSGMVWDESGGQIRLDSNVSPSEAMELHRAVLELKPKRSLEVGLAKGISTLAILGALEKNGCGHHVVMDPFQENYGNAGIEMVRRAGLEKWWEFHRKFAEEVIPALDPIQFAFIDASHLFDLTLMEFVLVDKKLEVGGVVAFHDMWMPSLRKCIRYILSNREYEVWSVSSGGQASSSSRRAQWLKSPIREFAGRVPVGKRVFSPEFLRPDASFGFNNLLFLSKRGDDKRTWTHHHPF